MHSLKILPTAFVAILSILGSRVQAQEIVRIEEDWELKVTQPDTQVDAPQIVTTLLPFGADSNILFQLDVNHGSAPEFSAGGLQVRICDGPYLIDERRIKEGIVLDHNTETVLWTTVVNKTFYGFNFGIINGSSSSFGSFGGSLTFASIGFSAAECTTLEHYQHGQTVFNSGVAYARNRVESLTLKNVRVFYSNGNVSSVGVNENIEDDAELD